MERKTPLHRLVGRYGVEGVARLAERSKNTVYRWLEPVDSGGSGGLVPVHAQRRIIENAQARGEILDFKDFAPQDGECVL